MRLKLILLLYHHTINTHSQKENGGTAPKQDYTGMAVAIKGDAGFHAHQSFASLRHGKIPRQFSDPFEIEAFYSC